MQTSCDAMQRLFSLYCSFSPPSFPFLLFSQNNGSFVPPLRCASSQKHSFSWGVYFCLVCGEIHCNNSVFLMCAPSTLSLLVHSADGRLQKHKRRHAKQSNLYKPHTCLQTCEFCPYGESHCFIFSHRLHAKCVWLTTDQSLSPSIKHAVFLHGQHVVRHTAHVLS